MTFHKKHLVVIVSLFSIIGTVLICQEIIRLYFFDKFLYFKSPAYGYLLKGSNTYLDKYGERSRDFPMISNSDKNILGVITKQDDDKYYTIAVIGDSLVWGQGITENQRFAHILNQKLNKIRPTKVYSFGFMGDNIFDDYQKYIRLQKNQHIDLYIFALYNNDLLLNKDDRYDTKQYIFSTLTQNCLGMKIIYDNPYDPKDTILRGTFYQPKLDALQSDTFNYCAFINLLPQLPKNNSIYIDLGSSDHNDQAARVFSTLIEELNPINIKDVPFADQKVSNSESHPSAQANSVFAKILFDKITNNNSYGFN